ncbi:hypothetical protein CLD22_15770 [Rubrivivax gelatinosus]|nr:hypothetical protein [Rubrivivax gelatinosus]
MSQRAPAYQFQPEQDGHAERQGPQGVVDLVADRLVVHQHRKQRQRQHEGIDQQAGEGEFEQVAAVRAQEQQNRGTHIPRYSLQGPREDAVTIRYLE